MKCVAMKLPSKWIASHRSVTRCCVVMKMTCDEDYAKQMCLWCMQMCCAAQMSCSCCIKCYASKCCACITITSRCCDVLCLAMKLNHCACVCWCDALNWRRCAVLMLLYSDAMKLYAAVVQVESWCITNEICDASRYRCAVMLNDIVLCDIITSLCCCTAVQLLLNSCSTAVMQWNHITQWTEVYSSLI